MLLPSLSAGPDDRTRIKDLVLCSYVDWAKEAKGIAGARTSYKKIIQNFYPTYGFYQKCLSLEKEGNDSNSVEYLYEMATRLNNHKEGKRIYIHIFYVYIKKINVCVFF